MRAIDRTQGRTQSDASDATLTSTSFLDDESPSKPSVESLFGKENIQRSVLCKFLWLLLDIVLLGFRQKFENRLEVYGAFNSEKGKLVDIGEWRTGQQDEWNRLGTTTSLMATVSAASLAFSGIDESWWVARGAFAGALGLSMCGYLVIHHFGVLSEGVDDKKILNAARGEFTDMTVVAIAMSIPVLLSVYSAALVLFGLIIFIVTVQLGTSSTPGTFSKSGFCIFAGIPILFGLVMLAFSVFIGEFMYRQAHIDKKHKDRHIV